MANDFFSNFDPSWWDKREMGRPDDPYNNIPALDDSDPRKSRYLHVMHDAFEKLYQESRAYEGDGWTFKKETQGIKIYSKDLPGSPIRCFRGIGEIDFAAELIRLHIVQLDLRRHWDKLFISGQYTLAVEPQIRLAYLRFRSGAPLVQSRDFSVLLGETMMHDTSEPTSQSQTQDGMRERRRPAVIQVAVSLTPPTLDPKDEVPPRSGFVRGHLEPSGFVIEPIDNDPNTGRPRCRVTYLAQLAPNGWVPQWLANIVNVQQPLCLRALRDVMEVTTSMANQFVVALHRLGAESTLWTPENIRHAIKTALKQVHGALPDILYEDLRYLISGTREEKVMKERHSGDTLEVVMHKMGWRECMHAIIKGILPYAKYYIDPAVVAELHGEWASAVRAWASGSTHEASTVVSVNPMGAAASPSQ